MKRIVLCFDGTWNKPADDALPENQQIETNVRRFYESVRPNGVDGVQQLSWYDAGVGTEWYNKLPGGAFGAMLDKHILDGYSHLVNHYEAGDEVYILGFSRGAYTARSLVGMIRNCGLVDKKFAAVQITAAYLLYRTRGDAVDSITARVFRTAFSREITIKFLGVWDTVGALGIPLQMLKYVNDELYKFHDTRLSRIVENAYHAIAIDEFREDYDVCLWDPESNLPQTLEQRWFCGAHANVGGGYPDRVLSDLALSWMQKKASDVGLAVNSRPAAPEGYLGPITNSYVEFLRGEYSKLKRPYLRKVLSTRFGNEAIDDSVTQRRKAAALNPRYAPTNSGLPPLA